MPRNTTRTVSNTPSKQGFAPLSKKPGTDILRGIDRILASILVDETNPEAARDCVITLCEEGIDWQGIFDLLWHNHLTPLFYYKLRQLDALQYLPQDIADSLHESFRANQIRNHLYLKEVLRLFEKLGQSGIEAVILKGGVALFQKIYAHPANRVLSDIDLFCYQCYRIAITRILEEMNYKLMASESRADTYTHQAKKITFEIHYRLFDAYLSKKEAQLLDRTYWQRKVRLVASPYPMFALAPYDQLIFNVYHAFVYHRDWIYDSLHIFMDFIALSRFYDDQRFVDKMSADASTLYLDQFFISFFYIMREKTGWSLQAALPISERLKKALDLFIRMESLYPSLHFIHTRRLILTGFKEKSHVRLQHLCQTIAGDMHTVGVAVRNWRK